MADVWKGHLSASQIRTLRECPLQWLYYVQQEPRDWDANRAYADCGQDIHLTIEQLLSGKETTPPLRTIPELMPRYEACISHFIDMGVPLGGGVEEKWEHVFPLSDGREVLVKGRVDYVLGDRVYDWKSGRPRSDEFIQAEVYNRLAMARGIERPRVTFAYLLTGNLKNFPPAPPFLLESILKSSLDIIESRAFFPHRGSHCTWCDWRDACRRDFP